jgi:transposase-like protein
MKSRQLTAEYRLAQWAHLVQERAANGMNVEDFCQSKGISRHAYYYWQRKLRDIACEELAVLQDRAASLSPQRFIEVELPNQSALSPAIDIDSHLRIDTAGLQITAGGNYPLDKLLAVLREVARSC